MARLKCPRGEKPVVLCVPEETPTRIAGLGSVTRTKCPVGMKPVSACPSDLAPGPTPQGQQFPYPEPERYGLGTMPVNDMLRLEVEEVRVYSASPLRRLTLVSAPLLVPPGSGETTVMLSCRVHRSGSSAGAELDLVASVAEIQEALSYARKYGGQASWRMKNARGVSSGGLYAQGTLFGVEVAPSVLPQLEVWMDGLVEKGFSGLGAVKSRGDSYITFKKVRIEPTPDMRRYQKRVVNKKVTFSFDRSRVRPVFQIENLGWYVSGSLIQNLRALAAGRLVELVNNGSMYQLKGEDLSEFSVWLDQQLMQLDQSSFFSGLGAASWDSQVWDPLFHQMNEESEVRFAPVGRVAVRILQDGKELVWTDLAASQVAHKLTLPRAMSPVGEYVVDQYDNTNWLVEDLKKAQVAFDELHQQGAALDGLGQAATPQCARGEVPVCTPRHAVPGLMGVSQPTQEGRAFIDSQKPERIKLVGRKTRLHGVTSDPRVFELKAGDVVGWNWRSQFTQTVSGWRPSSGPGTISVARRPGWLKLDVPGFEGMPSNHYLVRFHDYLHMTVHNFAQCLRGQPDPKDPAATPAWRMWCDSTAREAAGLVKPANERVRQELLIWLDWLIEQQGAV